MSETYVFEHFILCNTNALKKGEALVYPRNSYKGGHKTKICTASVIFLDF